MPRDVRTHTRRTASGRTTTVHQHQRRGNSARSGTPRKKRGPNPRHAWKLTKRARAAHKRGKKASAGVLAFIALGEVVAWFTLSGTSMMLAAVAGILALISYMLVR